MYIYIYIYRDREREREREKERERQRERRRATSFQHFNLRKPIFVIFLVTRDSDFHLKMTDVGKFGRIYLVHIFAFHESLSAKLVI